MPAHPPSITYIGYDTFENSVTFAFAGRCYEYFLPSPAALDKILYITRVASAAKACVMAKRLAIGEARV